LGFHPHKEERLRRARIDTPELRGVEKEASKKVKAMVIERYPVGLELMIESKKRERYDRFIAEIFHEGNNIHQWLLDNGHAKEY
jgi:micrococcal nuclease